MKTNHLIALGTALIAISYGLGRYAYGLFVPEIRTSLDISIAAVGVVASAGHLGYIAAIVLCMQLIRSRSPRVLILIGGMSAAAGILLVTVSTSAVTLAAGISLASMSAGWIWTAMPDAVRQIQPPDRHAQVLAWTNSGTGVGVLAAAPIALLLADWRAAYAAYTLLALVITLWAWAAIPRMQPDRGSRAIPLHLRWFVCPRSGPLLAMAIAVGLVGAVYWTFAVDLIVSAGLNAPWVGQLFWFVSGASGVAGIGVASMIRRYGIRRVIPVNAAVLAAALGLLAAAPASLAAVLVSAVFFGVGFIAVTGLLTIWSVNVFSQRPSAGLGAVLILIAGGQVVGPAAAGFIAEQIGLVPIFYGGALLALASMILRPRVGEDMRTPARSPA